VVTAFSWTPDTIGKLSLTRLRFWAGIAQEKLKHSVL
jgi:hypothetical protein